MKKRLLALLTGVMILSGVTGCGVTEDLAEGAKEQLEWTEENNALTNGRTPEEQIEDTFGIDISTEDSSTASSISSSTEFELGDTAEFMWTNDDGSSSHLEVTVTGCEPVYNGEKNVTAIFYTVTCIDGVEVSFDNGSFTCYADSKYVEQTYWEDYNNFSYGKVVPGTSYEGCYVADVDSNTVTTIDMYLSDAIWHCQKETVSTSDNIDFDLETVLAFSGLYTDGVDSFDCSMYSSPDGDSVGCYTAIINGVEYSGEMQFDQVCEYYVWFVDPENSVTIYFNNGGESPMVSLTVQGLDGSIIDTPEYPMTQHYES